MGYLEEFKEPLVGASESRDRLIEKYLSVRRASVEICQNLKNEDYVVQPCEEVSPPKWHLAHTTWFFEELILLPYLQNFSRFNDQYPLLFNSYYKVAGKHWKQGDRGQLSRPTVEEVLKYRKFVDEKVVELLQTSKINPELEFLLEVGFHHEQQHQELLYMDIKYILGTGPLFPVYREEALPPAQEFSNSWREYKEGLYEVGHSDLEFSYDNEGPKHKVYIYPFAIRKNTISNGEYLEFMDDGGYEASTLWLSDGWDWVSENSIAQPLYWHKKDNAWFEFTLHGLRPLDLKAPVTHISYYEAQAFANWTGYRLPTEHELETFLKGSETLEAENSELHHPLNVKASFGQVWCWTKSHYSSYPGYRAFEGAIGEYNGKFMCRQFVLRGGCIATPKDHYRHSYRNFYQPQQRWMFSGIRLAKDIQ